MICAIVPVKPLHLAKGRLAGLLTAAERRDLVLAMLADVLSALGVARGVARVGVVSGDARVLALATARGADALVDAAADLNAALAQGAHHYAARGATATLVLPADVPLVTAEEIERMVDAQEAERGIAIAPARDGGTNALLVRPPLALPFLFGADSLARHMDAARTRGLSARLVRGRGLELDIDRPDDLLRLAELEGETTAQRLARELCVCERVMCV